MTNERMTFEQMAAMSPAELLADHDADIEPGDFYTLEYGDLLAEALRKALAPSLPSTVGAMPTKWDEEAAEIKKAFNEWQQQSGYNELQACNNYELHVPRLLRIIRDLSAATRSLSSLEGGPDAESALVNDAERKYLGEVLDCLPDSMSDFLADFLKRLTPKAAAPLLVEKGAPKMLELVGLDGDVVEAVRQNADTHEGVYLSSKSAKRLLRLIDAAYQIGASPTTKKGGSDE